jgi:hypothetical protein
MPVFISHSFDDQEQFNNIADALESAGLPFWKPGEIMPGATLSEQLREAIGKSELCVFVATKGSVKSAWCGAELGAFWGAGKPVIIYIADSSLDEKTLPKQFAGHFLEGRITKVVGAVRLYLSKAEAKIKASGEAMPSVFREELRDLIESALERTQTRTLATNVMSQLSEMLSIPNLEESDRKALRSTLYSLLGLSQTAIQEAAPATWPHVVLTFSTTTGVWSGYARNEDWASYNATLTPCLLFRFDDQKRVAAAAILPRVVELDRGGTVLSEPIAWVGRSSIGVIETGYQP